MALDSKRRAALMFELRDGADLTQDALAEKSGVSERTIQRIEDPEDDIEPRYATREKLAKVLKVKPDELLPEAAPLSSETNGPTPDLSQAFNGNQPDDLQTQLAGLHVKLDRLLDALGIEEDATTTRPLQQINDLAVALPSLLARNAEAEAAKKKPAEGR